MRKVYELDTIKTGSVAATAVSVPIKGCEFIIANTGGQPLYFTNGNVVATSGNGMLIPAGQILNTVLSAEDSISVISNATGTTYSIMFLR